MKYGLRHKANRKVFIEQVVAPPRLCDWTTEMEKAQLFQFENEAEYSAEFVGKHFNVEVFEVYDINGLVEF